jgi:hypothetical protein
MAKFLFIKNKKIENPPDTGLGTQILRLCESSMSV